MRPPSMREIAEKAGVSTASVSMAMRNSPQISEATRDRILKIADEMGYRPNPMVSSLMTHIRSGKKASKGSTIAVLGPRGTADQLTNETKSSYPRILYKSIQERADALGYQVDLFSADQPDSSIAQLSRVIHYRNIRGVILPPFPSGQEEIEFDLDCNEFAVVAIGYSQNISQVNRVAHDQFKIAYGITQECIQRGYKRVGLLMQERFNTRTGHRYVSAFLGAHFDLGRPVRQKSLFVQNEYTTEEFLKWIEEQKIDCLVSQDMKSFQLLQAAGYEIPKHIGFAALSWQDEKEDVSGMYHDPYELGQVAVDLLTAHLQRNEHGIPKISKTMTIDPVWREADTLRPAPKKKPTS